MSLSGASLLVEGARPAEDGAQVKAGFDLAIRPNVTLTASFDGEFSGVQTIHGGRGGLRVNFRSFPARARRGPEPKAGD